MVKLQATIPWPHTSEFEPRTNLSATLVLHCYVKKCVSWSLGESILTTDGGYARDVSSN